MSRLTKTDTQARQISCLLAVFAFSFLLLTSHHALASSGCLAGVPCVANKTTNDPFNDSDGPNKTGPNREKTNADGCDADFMNQIYARAFLEAEREIVTGQVAMKKPDSVLEYTCYDRIVRETGEEAPPLFSENSFWENRTVDILDGNQVIISQSGDLDSILESYVLNALQQYRSQNFAHPFLGGAAEDSSGNAVNSDFESDTTDTCMAMHDVYNLAKCKNFATDDQLLSFNTLASLDPRILPAACNPSGTAITTDLINLARNQNFQYVNFDPVNTYHNFLSAPESASSCTGPPIPTGVMFEKKTYSVDLSGNVTVTGTETYNEAVCPNPGCRFDPNSGSGRCVP